MRFRWRFSKLLHPRAEKCDLARLEKSHSVLWLRKVKIIFPAMVDDLISMLIFRSYDTLLCTLWLRMALHGIVFEKRSVSKAKL